MNEAIKLAIEKGGYQSSMFEIILDPLFWQALAKALNLDEIAKEVSLDKKTYLVIGWKDFAHHFFELVLTGGDTEKFWKELLK